MLGKFVNPYVFVITFLISLVVVYFLHPEPTIIYRFPNPDNSGKLTYQDKDKNCYKYEATEVKCPSDPNLILEHPLIIH
jgi:hypothetical protein